MTTNVLRDHALKNVWCTPNQDRQYIIKPARIGPAYGNIGSVVVHNVSQPLPDFAAGIKRYYTVFDIGPLAAWQLNMPTQKDKWFNVGDLMNTRNLDVWLYKKSGIRIPSGLAWIRRTQNGSYIIAVEMSRFFQWDLNDEDEELYVRFYSNSFFESSRFMSGGYNNQYGVEYIHGQLGSTLSVAQLQSWLMPRVSIQQASQDNAMGGLYGFSDGKLVWPLTSPNRFPVGSYVELVFDRSIRATRQISLEDMESFISTMDNKDKFIVMPWVSNKETNIEFYDDIDFYLCRGNRGVYIHRNELDCIRQLTNASYSLGHQHVNGFIADNPWLDENDLTFPGEKPFVLVRMRHSGWRRSLVSEHMHLNELIKLGEEGVTNALLGSLSNIPVWRAEYIEASKYNEIQTALTANEVTEEEAYDAYRYDSATRMILPTDLKGSNNGVVGSVNIYFETPNTFKNVSALIFDSAGNLINVMGCEGGGTISSPIISGDTKTLTQHAKLIEGRLCPDALTTTIYDTLEVTNEIPVREQGFRCYMCTRVGGLPDNDWRVVEESEGYWTVSGDGLSIIWDPVAVSNANGYPAVRFSDSVVYTETVQFQSEEDGVMTFDVAHDVYVDGDVQFQVEAIPYGTLMVFAKDSSGYNLLVEGIDYYVQWPTVVVVKKYTEKTVSTLCYGLCDDDMSRSTVREFGYSYRGIMSADNRWHVRDNKNVIITLGGKVIPPESIKAFENYWETNIVPYSNVDVKPFAVIDVVQTIEPVLGQSYDTLTQRKESLDRVALIEDYMTQYMEYDVPTAPNTTSVFWVLYSPFISRIINEMIAGRFSDLPPINEMATIDIQTRVADFVWLLDFDPINNGADFSNAVVVPHNYNDPVGVTLNQYMFIKRLVDMYLGGQINLSAFLTVEE